VWRFEGFELDTQRYELRCAGTAIPVEPQVFDVLTQLIKPSDSAEPRHHGRIALYVSQSSTLTGGGAVA
jgi:hypothetical protein